MNINQASLSQTTSIGVGRWTAAKVIAFMKYQYRRGHCCPSSESFISCSSTMTRSMVHSQSHHTPHLNNNRMGRNTGVDLPPEYSSLI